MEQGVLIHVQGKNVFKKEEESGETVTIPKNSNLLLIWNILVMLAYLFNIFEIPVALFFTEQVYLDETSVQ